MFQILHSFGLLVPPSADQIVKKYVIKMYAQKINYDRFKFKKRNHKSFLSFAHKEVYSNFK